MPESAMRYRATYWGGFALYSLLAAFVALALSSSARKWAFLCALIGGGIYLGIGESGFWLRQMKRVGPFARAFISILIVLQIAVGLALLLSGHCDLPSHVIGLFLSVAGTFSGIVLVGWLLIPARKTFSICLSLAALLLYLGLGANVLWGKWWFEHHRYWYWGDATAWQSICGFRAPPSHLSDCQWRRFLSQYGMVPYVEYDSSNGTVSGDGVVSVGP